MQPTSQDKSIRRPSLKLIISLIALFLSLINISCKKLIEIPPPTGSITTSQVFSTDEQATSATTSMYLKMINSSQIFSSSGMTLFGGVSADELASFDQSTSSLYVSFQKNSLLSSNTSISNFFWNPAYSIIYTANAIIEGLENNASVHDSLKNELTGEAEFVRAFSTFYLVNLFGDIPFVSTTNWHNTNLLSRTSASMVYQDIITDLKKAQSKLPADYSVGNGQRIIPNKWAATALLARVYLYIGDWPNAEMQSTEVINNSNLFSLDTNLNNVFLINSTEAIWQLQQNNKGISYNATPEGFLIIPKKLNSTFAPSVYLTSQLLNAFEPYDRRRYYWVDSTLYRGVEYYFPYKYKMGAGQATPNGPYSENYQVLRLAEQYLIRAEARAQKNDLSNATLDLNIIRKRAGLSDTTASAQTDLLTIIAHERQVEFFSEWGHRWLDLKRTNQATTILKPIKPNWNVNAELYPIPIGELTTDPNLTQNNGY